MTEPGGLTRRRFLYSSALTAGAATFVGCQDDGSGDGGGGGEGGGRASTDRKGSETEPLTAPTEFGEAPMLAEMVEAGELPPVEERLPSNPYVVPHRWVEIGKYGGKLIMSIDDSSSNALKEYSYGHSLLRFLNDGLDIGPGLVESWESNEDASEWTFHFREGLKWSDGEPWTTADILYWWEDLVQHPDHPEGPPDDVRSGEDTTAEVLAQDDVTLVLRFDAPAPITPERLAAWVNRPEVGPWWMAPRHYLEQFHPAYNDQVGSDWVAEHDQRADYSTGKRSCCRRRTPTSWRPRPTSHRGSANRRGSCPKATTTPSPGSGTSTPGPGSNQTR